MLRNILLITVISLTTSLLASNPIAMNTDTSSGSKIQGKVQGFVLQNTLPLAQVVVYSENSDIVKVTTTNQKGEFAINDLPAGMYYLVVSYMGYKPGLVDNIQIKSADEAVTLKDLSLERAFYKIEEVVVKAERKCNKNEEYLSSIVQ